MPASNRTIGKTSQFEGLHHGRSISRRAGTVFLVSVPAAPQPKRILSRRVHRDRRFIVGSPQDLHELLSKKPPSNVIAARGLPRSPTRAAPGIEHLSKRPHVTARGDSDSAGCSATAPLFHRHQSLGATHYRLGHSEQTVSGSGGKGDINSRGILLDPAGGAGTDAGSSNRSAQARSAAWPSSGAANIASRRAAIRLAVGSAEHSAE